MNRKSIKFSLVQLYFLFYYLSNCCWCLFEKCNHVVDLKPGQKIYVNSPYYPAQYPIGTSCRYLIKAPLDHQLKFTCNIDLELEASKRCESEMFHFNREGNELLSGSEYFCGKGKIERRSYMNHAVISYMSKSRVKLYTSHDDTTVKHKDVTTGTSKVRDHKVKTSTKVVVPETATIAQNTNTQRPLFDAPTTKNNTISPTSTTTRVPVIDERQDEAHLNEAISYLADLLANQNKITTGCPTQSPTTTLSPDTLPLDTWRILSGNMLNQSQANPDTTVSPGTLPLDTWRIISANAMNQSEPCLETTVPPDTLPLDTWRITLDNVKNKSQSIFETTVALDTLPLETWRIVSGNDQNQNQTSLQITVPPDALPLNTLDNMRNQSQVNLETTASPDILPLNTWRIMSGNNLNQSSSTLKPTMPFDILSITTWPIVSGSMRNQSKPSRKTTVIPGTLPIDTWRIVMSNALSQSQSVRNKTDPDYSSIPLEFIRKAKIIADQQNNGFSGIAAGPEYGYYDNKGGGRFSCLVEVVETPCDCGWHASPKVAGATGVAGLNEFPSMAGIKTTRHNQIFCGAAIIHHRYLLSAAHCFVTPETSHPERLRAVVGENDLSTVFESLFTRTYEIEAIIPHELFSTSVKNARNDIALLRTRIPIEWNRNVGPACLPFRIISLPNSDTRRKMPLSGQRVDTAGWGTTSFGGLQSMRLLKTTLDVIGNDQCRQTLHSVPPGVFCTFTPGRDTCQYDSGGSLYVREERLYAVGIVSYGFACASHRPSVNTRIASFLRWIQEKTPEVKYCVK